MEIVSSQFSLQTAFVYPKSRRAILKVSETKGRSQFGKFQSRERCISLVNALFSISIWRE